MSIVTRLPITVSSSLPVISQADLESFVSWEIDSYDHWIFDRGTSAGLAGLSQSKVLTLQGSAPTYSSSYISLPGTPGDALLTDLTETANQVDTIFIVLRSPAAFNGIHFPFGTLSTGTGNVFGGSPYLEGAANTYPREFYATYRGTDVPGTPITTIDAANQWYFICVSRDFNSATKTFRILVGGNGIISYTVAGTYNPAPGRFIGLGNGYYTVGSSALLDIAEFGIFNRALSDDELNNLYSRRKLAAAARGISVA